MTDDRKLYWSCFYSFFYCGIVMITIGSALPDLREYYGLTASSSGALLSCYSLGNLASGIITGFLSLYLGQKFAAVILSSLVWAGMLMLTGGHVVALLFGACFIVGVGRGSLITFSQRTINILTGGSTRTTGLLHATFAVGAIISPLMFSALRVISWKAGIILVAVLGVMATLSFIAIKDYSRLEGSDKSGGNSDRSLSFFRDSGFIVIACLMFLYLCCEFALNGWIVTYMTHKNMPLSFSHLMASLLWVVMLLGRLFCVWLAKYVRQRVILLALSAGSALSFGLMLMAEGAPGISLTVALTGFFMSGISPIIYGSSAPYTNKYPLAMGMLFTIGCTGGTIMPLITGVIAENWGFDGGMSAILAGFMMLLVFAVINMKRRDAD
ncbi:MAG: MFS transporter [Synergistaceae bacterium]|nr:MFS transporter [Synergistaceae bacterium]